MTQVLKTQFNFARGELAPNFRGNSNSDQYQQGCAKLENWICDSRGGLFSRPGTKHIMTLPDTIQAVRLFEFRFAGDDSNTYLLVVSVRNVRFVQNGILLEQDEEPYYVNLFRDRIDFAFTLGDRAADKRKQEAFLRDLQMFQIRDRLRFTHPELPPRDLVRRGHFDWAVEMTETVRRVRAPYALRADSRTGDRAGVTYLYQVTAIDKDGVESRPAVMLTDNQAFLEDTRGARLTLKWNLAGPAPAGYRVYKSNPGDFGSTNGRYFFTDAAVGFIGDTLGRSFTDDGYVPDFSIRPPDTIRDPFARGSIKSVEPTAALSALWSNGRALVSNLAASSGVIVPAFLHIVEGGTNGPVYALKILDAGSGVTEESWASLAQYYNITLDNEDGNPYPRCGTLFQQRQFFASSDVHPLRLWGSHTGIFDNYNLSSFVGDDTAIELDLDSPEYSQIRHLLSYRNQLLVFSETGVWAVYGNEGIAISPSNARADVLLNEGAARVAPVLVEGHVVYVSSRGNDPRIIFYSHEGGGLQNRPLGHFSNHFYGQEIVSMAYSITPIKVLWMVRKDGVVITLPIDIENNLYATASMTTGVRPSAAEDELQPETDKFIAVAVVRRELQDDTYFAIERGDTTAEEPNRGAIHIELLYKQDPNQILHPRNLDSAVVLEPDTERTEIMVPHLAGRKVAFLSFDGIVGKGEVDTDGLVRDITDPTGMTLSADTLTKALQSGLFVGLPYMCVCKTLASQASRPIDHKKKRGGKLFLNLYNTGAISIGRERPSQGAQGSTLVEQELPPQNEDGRYLVGKGAFSAAFGPGFDISTEFNSVVPFTGIFETRVAADFSFDNGIYFVNDSVYPAAILSYFEEIEVDSDPRDRV